MTFTKVTSLVLHLVKRESWATNVFRVFLKTALLALASFCHRTAEYSAISHTILRVHCILVFFPPVTVFIIYSVVSSSWNKSVGIKCDQRCISATHLVLCRCIEHHKSHLCCQWSRCQPWTVLPSQWTAIQLPPRACISWNCLPSRITHYAYLWVQTGINIHAYKKNRQNNVCKYFC